MAGQWTVVGQRSIEDLTPQGTFRESIEVTFELASGTISTVKVPVNLYSEEYVREQISAKAAAMAAVEGLSG